MLQCTAFASLLALSDPLVITTDFRKTIGCADLPIRKIFLTRPLLRSHDVLLCGEALIALCLSMNLFNKLVLVSIALLFEKSGIFKIWKTYKYKSATPPGNASDRDGIPGGGVFSSCPYPPCHGQPWSTLNCEGARGRLLVPQLLCGVRHHWFVFVLFDLRRSIHDRWRHSWTLLGTPHCGWSSTFFSLPSSDLINILRSRFHKCERL